MKYLHLLAGAALLLGATSAAAQDPMGVWRTETNDEGNWGLVEISACGDLLCGVLVGSSVEGSDRIGTQIIKNMEASGEGEWDGGEIYAPDDDRWYIATMELQDENTLEVAGCVLGGIICRAQIWTREP